MPNQRSMTILRDNFVRERGCVEFSWVPTGKRLNIILPPGQQQGSNSVTTNSATNVQIYVLTQETKSLESWQFPPVGQKQIAAAVISVREAQAPHGLVEAVVFYEDGSSENFRKELENKERKCPG